MNQLPEVEYEILDYYDTAVDRIWATNAEKAIFRYANKSDVSPSRLREIGYKARRATADAR